MSRKLGREETQAKMMRLWSEYHRTPRRMTERRRHLKRAAERAARKLKEMR